ncbi:MAG: hypothetical protein LBS09_09455 [Bacteroidales bacterium]|nr:hypothetical protein [Bacteroidales bacterium]
MQKQGAFIFDEGFAVKLSRTLLSVIRIASALIMTTDDPPVNATARYNAGSNAGLHHFHINDMRDNLICAKKYDFSGMR